MRHNSAKDALTWTQSISQRRQRPFCILQHVLNLPTSSFHPGMRKCLPLFYYVSCMLTSPKPQHSGPPRREFFQCCRQSIWPSGSETHGRSISRHEVGVWGIDLLLDRCHDVWPPRLATLLRLLCSIHVNPNLDGYLQKSKTETLKYWQLTPNYSKVQLESTSGKAWGLAEDRRNPHQRTQIPWHQRTATFFRAASVHQVARTLAKLFERNGDNFGQPQAKPFHVLRKASHVLILQRVLPRVSLDVHSACFASVVVHSIPKECGMTQNIWGCTSTSWRHCIKLLLVEFSLGTKNYCI